MERQKAQELCRNYAESMHWPLLRVAEWHLMDKYDWKVFLNIAPVALLTTALQALRAMYLDMAG